MHQHLKAFSPQMWHQDVKKQYAGRTVETFQDFLAWPATDNLIDRGEEKRRNTQNNTQAIRTEMYFLEVVTSVIYIKAQKHREMMGLIKGAH